MLIKYIGVILIILGAALLIVTVLRGMKTNIKAVRRELNLITSSGYAISHVTTKQSRTILDEAPVKVPQRKRSLSREAADILKMVEDELQAESEQEAMKNIGSETQATSSLGSNNSTDILPTGSKGGTDLLPLNRVKERTDVLPQQSQKRKEGKGTDVLPTGGSDNNRKTGTDVLKISDQKTVKKAGTDVLPNVAQKDTDALSSKARTGTDVLLTTSKTDNKGTDVLPMQKNAGTDVLPSAPRKGTDVLHVNNQRGIDVLPSEDKKPNKGTDVLPLQKMSSTDVLPVRKTADTDVLPKKN